MAIPRHLLESEADPLRCGRVLEEHGVHAHGVNAFGEDSDYVRGEMAWAVQLDI